MSGTEIPVRVARVETVAERIKRIRFVPVDGAPLPTYSAGAHTVVTMRDGSKTIKNPYSLMGKLNDTTGYEISVLKTHNSHGGSLFVLRGAKNRNAGQGRGLRRARPRPAPAPAAGSGDRCSPSR